MLQHNVDLFSTYTYFHFTFPQIWFFKIQYQSIRFFSNFIFAIWICFGYLGHQCKQSELTLPTFLIHMLQMNSV